MPEFEPTGDLLTDLQSAIDTQTMMYITYTDRKGEYSERNIAPHEIRGDVVYAHSMGPEKYGLRMFKLDSIGQYQVLDETFDRDSL